ncbi:MAG: 2'-5' RNA ligase family protein [Cyclobacteriaceae bacterium]|nr:2'-5' RNA ligase family protein [Cyclobacteriaceae bacterium]
MKDKSLYFIALIPDEPLREQVNALKLEFSKSYHTVHALKSPPHITLIPPFTLENKNEKRIAKHLLDFAGSCTSFEVSISDYGAFKPRVVYLKIIKNDMLESLQKSLVEKCNKNLGFNINMSKPFSPHMTLAFRDLSPQMFYKAWEKYKFETFRTSFKAKSLFLLKHNGKCWDIAYDIHFPAKLPS